MAWRGGNVGVGRSGPGGCVGDPGAVAPAQRHARSRTVRSWSRSRPEVPFATLIRKARARPRVSCCVPRFALLREAKISTNGFEPCSGVSSSSFWAFSRVVMPHILAPANRPALTQVPQLTPGGTTAFSCAADVLVPQAVIELAARRQLPQMPPRYATGRSCAAAQSRRATSSLHQVTERKALT